MKMIETNLSAQCLETFRRHGDKSLTRGFERPMLEDREDVCKISL